VSLLDNMPGECSVKRPVYALDKYGGDAPTYLTVKTGLACWPQPASASQILEFAKRDQQITHSVFFPGGQPSWTYNGESQSLQPGDVISMTDGAFDGQEFEFKSGDDSSAGLAVVWRAMVEKVRT
jgi:hypothetical protein